MRSMIAPKLMLAPQNISCVGATLDSKAQYHWNCI